MQGLKRFFDVIDVEKKGYITIDDYGTHSALDENNGNELSKISNSLFKHFDREGAGMITF